MGLKNKKTYFFAYTKPKNFSGQTAASELIISSLQARGAKCVPIILYPLTRTLKNPVLGYLELFFRQFKAVPNVFRLLFSWKPVLHLNLGQSYWSFVRVGIWYFPVKLLNRSIRVVTSLHGSNFMTWDPGALITKLFLLFLKSSRVISVLGDNQKKRLEQLGITPAKVRVVCNASTLNPVSDSFVVEKHNNPDAPVTLLHLSLLIESKGFTLFLEALELLAARNIGRPVRAILCGPITFSPYCKQFNGPDDKREWIESKIETINSISEGRIVAEWIPGASGTDKQKLFEESHIFVFPTTFPVEAQPIVLLEALATGCSIITTTAGEIPSTLNSECAIFLNRMDNEYIAEEIYRLAINQEKRTSMALSGTKLVRGPLSIDSHLKIWDSIFKEIAD